MTINNRSDDTLTATLTNTALLTEHPTNLDLDEGSLDEIFHIAAGALEEASARLLRLSKRFQLESHYGIFTYLDEDRLKHLFTYLAQDCSLYTVRQCHQQLKAYTGTTH